MQQELRKQILLTAILAIAVVGGSLLLWWARGTVVKKRAATIDLFEKIASVEQNRTALEREYQEFEAVKQEIGSLEKNFYDADTVPLFLSDLETAARNALVEFEITSADIQTATKERPAQLMVQFRARGSYAALLSFSRQLEAKPYQVFFDRYFLLADRSEPTVTGRKKTPPTPLWQLYGTLRLTTFR